MATTQDRDDDFRRFVEAHWLGLVRSAYLLVGDDSAAEDLVQQTLATVHRHWHRQVREGAPMAYVRTALVNHAISNRRHTRLSESLFGGPTRGQRDDPQGGFAIDPHDDHRDVDDRDVVVRALRDLPPRMRAVVVLRYFDDLTEAATAELLGMTVGSVKSQTPRGLQRLRTAVAAVAVGECRDPPMSLRLVEDEVREALVAATEHLSSPPDPYALVMRTVDARGHRRRAVLTGSGVAALAVAWVVGLAAWPSDDESRAGPPANEQTTRTPRWGLPAGWPPRGGLGTDPAFAAEFDRSFGTDHLIYAEDGEAGRLAIAVSSAQEAVVLHGPRGTAVEELARVPGLLADTLDVVVALPVNGGHLIIALMPANLGDAQLATPTVARDGSVQRSWQQVPVQEGVARMVTSEPLAVIRVRTPAGDGPPDVVVGADAPLGTLTCGRCDSAWFAEEGLAGFHAQAAAAVGAEPNDVSARLLLDIALPSPSGGGGDAPGRVVGYLATLPSGGLLRATYVATTGPGAPTMTMVEPLRPLPADDETRPVLIPAGVAGPALIVAPGSSRVAFTPRGDADAISDVVLTDGVAVLTEWPRDPADYRVTSEEADGRVARTWHGHVLDTDDPFQVLNQFRNRP